MLEEPKYFKVKPQTKLERLGISHKFIWGHVNGPWPGPRDCRLSGNPETLIALRKEFWESYTNRSCYTPSQLATSFSDDAIAEYQAAADLIATRNREVNLPVHTQEYMDVFTEVTGLEVPACH